LNSRELRDLCQFDGHQAMLRKEELGDVLASFGDASENRVTFALLIKL
jgi:hypothetical protein